MVKAILFSTKDVQVTDSSIENGGSWREGPDGVVAYNWQALEFFYDKLLQAPAPQYIDVGANTGAFTLLAAKIPDARVLAIEPNKDVRPILIDNLSKNDLEGRVEVSPYAVWSDCQELTFYGYPKQHGYSRLIHAFEGGGGKPYQVEAVSLDHFSGKHHGGEWGYIPYLIKIDVEGAELRVLEGALDTLRYNPGIMMEWWPPNTKHFGYHPEEIDKMLASLGYSKQQVSATFVYYEHKGEKE